jgi:trimeric autotransporter adhesin
MKRILVLSCFALALWLAADTQPAQGTAFTYQGRLADGGAAVTGIYDLRFSLYDSTNNPGVLIAGPVTNSSVGVSNGLFTVTIDFGAGVFTGADRWLEIGTRSNGVASFTPLSPRQQLTPTPYAISAGNLNGSLSSANLSGTYSNAVTFSNATNSFSGSGAGLTGVNAASLGGLNAANYWNLGGNSGVGGPVLGTMDVQPLRLYANTRRVFHLTTASIVLSEFESWNAVNIIGGASGNTVSNGVMGGTISGGGSVTNSSFGTTTGPNIVMNSFGTVGGGLNNTAGKDISAFGADTSLHADTVSGGEGNSAANGWASVGGGLANYAGSGQSAIAGGGHNGISDLNNFLGFPQSYSRAAFIGAGEYNVITPRTEGSFPFYNYLDALDGVIGGGISNTINGASFAVIPGGRENSVSGSYGFAAGRRARANHDGAFVWADSTDADFASTGANQFLIRARGGIVVDPLTSMSFGTQVRQMINLWGTQYGIGVQDSSVYFRCDNSNPNNGFFWYRGGTHSDTYGNSGGGSELMHLTSGGLWVNTTFVSASDRNVKEDFADVDSSTVLEKVVRLPIQTWVYKNDPATKHLGPVAQDFYAAFGVGPDDKHIATVDADGVALAAIQGLNQKLMEQGAILKSREAEIQELRLAVAELQQAVKTLRSER